MKRKQPQGTTRRVNPEKEQRLFNSMGERLANAVLTLSKDHDVKALAEAKRDNDTKRMGELLPILRRRYGEKMLARIFKSL